MHPNTANALNNLAVLLMKQARYAEAEPFYKRALEVWESSWGRTASRPHEVWATWQRS